MKPDRFAVHCDIDGVTGPAVSHIARHLLLLLEQSLTLAAHTGTFEWLVDIDGATRGGDGQRTAEVVELARATETTRELYVSINGTSAIHRSLWAELSVAPGPSGQDQEYEAYLQIAFPGELLEKSESQPLAELFIDTLRTIVTTVPGCTQAFISDDIELDELPLELAMKLSSRRARADSATTLRNLSWITFLGPTMTRELRDLMPQTEFSASSWTCLGEGILLQFTESIEDFTGDQVAQAWRQLLPLLATTDVPKRPPRYASRTVNALVG